ncbi:tetratricopeptide repeat protein [Sphingopyxis macrogoltabida]|uniref:TPR repeat protein n=1 Tax=Sphingopyxis macrogoltabida TaxID=33050 RepID=A0AAC9AU14_SPHMC|nr:SEL1-like repeat protein [Sphingopyxis macrogoltabida]ALJ11564.1 TPR repeat protein [Sphingopyxis macrogoltabida]AMU87754.1 TPR repeat protein [Sphingopyxis macrogoltabida]
MDTEAYSKALAICRAPEADISEAYKLLSQASQEGDTRATYALSTWYLFGNEVVEKNEEYGVKLLKTLEKSNIAEAIFDLAVSYDYGKHVKKNNRKAMSLYMRAALLGDKASCEQVSQYYSEGKSVPYDKLLADAWKERAEQEENSISPSYRVWL